MEVPPFHTIHNCQALASFNKAKDVGNMALNML